MISASRKRLARGAFNRSGGLSGDSVEPAHLGHSGSSLGRQVVGRLHRQPGARRTNACLFEAHGEVGADPSMTVQHTTHRNPGNAQPIGRLTNTEIQFGEHVQSNADRRCGPFPNTDLDTGVDWYQWSWQSC